MDEIKVVGCHEKWKNSKGKKNRRWIWRIASTKKKKKNRRKERRGSWSDRGEGYWLESKGKTKPRKHCPHNFRPYPPPVDSMQLLHRFGLTSGWIFNLLCLTVPVFCTDTRTTYNIACTLALSSGVIFFRYFSLSSYLQKHPVYFFFVFFSLLLAILGEFSLSRVFGIFFNMPFMSHYS